MVVPSIRTTTTTRISGPNDLSRKRSKERFPLFLRVLGQLFYVSGFLICYLLVASLFDEGDDFSYAPSDNYNNDNKPNKNPATTKIAYAITVTSCGAAYNQTTADPNAVTFHVAEGAAVLAHSVHRVSVRATAAAGTSDGGGKYDYQLVALYHPEAEPCMDVLRQLGYKTIPRQVFVKIDEIEGDYLREKIGSSGCCGERENIKFEAYTLTEYPLVLLLDLDCLILKPLDVLFDFMLHGIAPPAEHLQWPKRPFPKETELMFTLDYHMVSPQRDNTPVQGGFLLIKPNLQTYEELKAIAKEGDYRSKGGWGGKGGKYWGSHTVQGMVPYYYQILHQGNKSVELNRCVYNNMVAPPRAGANAKFKCYVKHDPCQDCQVQPLNQIASTHFTNCQKPWYCQRSSGSGNSSRLCRQLHHAWFQVRSELEIAWGRNGTGPAKPWEDYDQFFGYCERRGSVGYRKIEQPYGRKISSLP